MNRAVASLSFPGEQDKSVSSIFPHFYVFSLIFPQLFFIFFLILDFRVGESPTREGLGYATENEPPHKMLNNYFHKRTHLILQKVCARSRKAIYHVVDMNTLILLV